MTWFDVINDLNQMALERRIKQLEAQLSKQASTPETQTETGNTMSQTATVATTQATPVQTINEEGSADSVFIALIVMVGIALVLKKMRAKRTPGRLQ